TRTRSFAPSTLAGGYARRAAVPKTLCFTKSRRVLFAIFMHLACSNLDSLLNAHFVLTEHHADIASQPGQNLGMRSQAPRGQDAKLFPIQMSNNPCSRFSPTPGLAVPQELVRDL